MLRVLNPLHFSIFCEKYKLWFYKVEEEVCFFIPLVNTLNNIRQIRKQLLSVILATSSSVNTGA